MSATIKRGGKGVRRSAAARKGQQARAQTRGALDRAMGAVPLSEDQWSRVFLVAIGAVLVALALFVAALAGLPAVMGARIDDLAAGAGFKVVNIQVRGVERMNETKVYAAALATRDRAMSAVDVDALRAELVGLNWVRDARVSRQWPSSLVIDIVERDPHAVLRTGGGLVLIDATGHELEPVGAAAAKGQMVVAGRGAGRQVQGLTRLLGAAPALRPQVREAEWVGNRRWNLTFTSGQVLALPEERSRTALIEFARQDGLNRLLGGKAQAFDMRVPGQIAMRCPECVAQAGGPDGSGPTGAAAAAVTAQGAD